LITAVQNRILRIYTGYHKPSHQWSCSGKELRKVRSFKPEKYITKHINKYEFPFSNINKDAKKNDY